MTFLKKICFNILTITNLTTIDPNLIKEGFFYTVSSHAKNGILSLLINLDHLLNL